MTPKQRIIARRLGLIVLILRPFDMHAYASYFGNTSPWYMFPVAFYVVFQLLFGIYALIGELPLSQEEKEERHKRYIEGLIEELNEEGYTVLPPKNNTDDTQS